MRVHFIYVRRGPHLPPVYSRQTSDAPRHSASSSRETWRTAPLLPVAVSGTARPLSTCQALAVMAVPAWHSGFMVPPQAGTWSRVLQLSTNFFASVTACPPPKISFHNREMANCKAQPLISSTYYLYDENPASVSAFTSLP